MDEDKEIISSHIFIFPFRWDFVKNQDYLNACIDDRLNVDKFIKSLKDNWKIDFNAENIAENKQVKNDDEYNTYSYFYNNVRKAIYGSQEYIKMNKHKSFNIKNSEYYLGKFKNQKNYNRIVRCFNYKNLDANSTYEIYVQKNKNKDNKVYKLKIKHIKLKIYDTGVATLSYFLENKEYDEKDDILLINDYGRRIYPQYIPLEEVQNSFLAKKLLLKIKNNHIEEDFIYDSKTYPAKISKTIMKILGKNFISTEKELKEKLCYKQETIFVRPIIDDRMFVICYYNDNVFSRILTKYRKDEYLKNDFWYQLLFIDNQAPTCQDESMKKELLLKSTYLRWKDYGTLFGISRYSFVLLCDESNFSKNVLYNHINTIYYEMILLVLVQRASTLRFSDETSRIASFESKNIYEQIRKLQEYYIRFINTIYFREVTAQEQGIELYDKLMEFMRIEKEVKRLDGEIDEIQRYITLETNEKTNELLNIITYIGLDISILTLIATIFGLKKRSTQNFIYWFVFYQLISLISIFRLLHVSRKYVDSKVKLILILKFALIILVVGIIYF